jgi:hypothetical protein
VNYYFNALLLITCLYALAAGGAPERWGAGIYALACIASHFLFSAAPIKFRSVETGVFIVDVLVFVAFAMLALRANRFWPIWVSALLGLGVLAHLARWAGPDTIPWAYQLAMSVWSYPILAIIALGTFNHRRRLARDGTDRSWSSSFRVSDPRRPAGPTT